MVRLRTYRIRLIALTLLCVAMGADVWAANGYKSDLLKEMATVMGIRQQVETLADGTYYGLLQFRKRPLTVAVMQQEVTHIGYRFFTAAQRADLGTAVPDFIERYWLSLDLPLKRVKSVDTQLREDHFDFVVGSPQSIDRLQSDTTLSLFVENVNRTHYIFEWKDEKGTVCKLQFPVDAELLNGRNVLENDYRLAQEITRTKTGKISRRYTETELRLVPQRGYYLYDGGTYYLSDLTSKRYFVRDSVGGFVPLYDASMKIETVSNLLTDTDMPEAEHYELTLRQQTYNYTQKMIRTNVRQFLTYCLQNGCKPYAGIVSCDSTTMDVLLVLRNSEVGYHHVARMKFDLSEMAQGKGKCEARLNAFIPLLHIKNLYKQ